MRSPPSSIALTLSPQDKFQQPPPSALWATSLGLFLAASPVIKEELFASLNCPLGKDPNSMIPVHHDHFGITVGVYRMVCKSNFVAFPGSIHYKIIVEVEEEAGHVQIHYFLSTVLITDIEK